MQIEFFFFLISGTPTSSTLQRFAGFGLNAACVEKATLIHLKRIYLFALYFFFTQIKAMFCFCFLQKTTKNSPKVKRILYLLFRLSVLFSQYDCLSYVFNGMSITKLY